MDTAPHTIFRWEAASGLEHTCYACTTKMNNPKARQTCYGIHSIPCTRYHQTMHAIGTSHNCFACIQADSLHESRHRRIAELVAEYKDFEESEHVSTVKGKTGTFATLPLRERNPNTPPQANIDAPVRGNRRWHPLPAPLLIPDELDNFGEDDEAHSPDNTSATTPSTASSGALTTPKTTKAEARTAKRAAKSEKSQRKSLKNQFKLAHTVPVKQTDVENVAAILHGQECESARHGEETEVIARHPLASDKSIEEVIERNRRYVSNIREHKAALLREIGGRRKMERRERVKKQQAQQKDFKIGRAKRVVCEDDDQERTESEEEEGLVVDAILKKLGITLPTSPRFAQIGDNHLTTPNKRHSTSSASGGSSCHGHGKLAVLAQLRVAIGDDLQKHENEQRQTCIRAGGFWRYVGRPVFDRMCEISERIDWKTGVIFKDAAVGDDDSYEGADGDDENDIADADTDEGARKANGQNSLDENNDRPAPPAMDQEITAMATDQALDEADEAVRRLRLSQREAVMPIHDTPVLRIILPKK